MKTSVFGNNFCSLLTAQSQAWGLPAGAPSPGFPLSASPCVGGTGFRKGDQPGFSSGPVTNKQCNVGRGPLTASLFQLQKVETKSYSLLKWSSIRLTRGNIHGVPWLGSCHVGCLINGTSLLRQTRSTQIRDDYYGVASLSILPHLTLKSCFSVVERENLINAHLLIIIIFLHLLIFCCVKESWTALVSSLQWGSFSATLWRILVSVHRWVCAVDDLWL